MRGLTQASGASGCGAIWRQLLLAITVLAFAQAAYVTQTHLHAPARLSGNSAFMQPGHGKVPAPDDPAHCPFCQEYLLAGAYVAPPPIVLPQPTAAAFEAYQLLHVLPFVAALSHSWHGRAPPRF
ncbi:MAG TPA: hypothetical protein VHU23_11010 [Rhizomicrobium sp.]|nr:hypothetical protein [Rhizomicrobium sp.]